jgi:hypothetical protein
MAACICAPLRFALRWTVAFAVHFTVQVRRYGSDYGSDQIALRSGLWFKFTGCITGEMFAVVFTGGLHDLWFQP